MGPASSPVELEVSQAKGSSLTTSYKEEDRALNLGLEWVASRQECATVAFCTDSLSLLQAIENLNPTTTQVRQRMEELNSFLNLLYVPGHKDVPGNELADKWAKDAANLPGPCLDNAIKIGEAKSIAKRQLKDPPSSHPTISKTWDLSLAREMPS